MKLTDLERHLRDHDCELLRQGSRHAIWLNLANGAIAAVPRHREVKSGTTRTIRRELGIVLPASMQ